MPPLSLCSSAESKPVCALLLQAQLDRRVHCRGEETQPWSLLPDGMFYATSLCHRAPGIPDSGCKAHHEGVCARLCLTLVTVTTNRG